MAGPVAATSLLVEPTVSAQVDEPTINIKVVDGSVIVSGGQGKKLQVVSLTGRLLATYSIESPNQRVDLNLTKGCYILKIGNLVRKVSLQ